MAKLGEFQNPLTASKFSVTAVPGLVLGSIMLLAVMSFGGAVLNWLRRQVPKGGPGPLGWAGPGSLPGGEYQDLF